MRVRFAAAIVLSVLAIHATGPRSVGAAPEPSRADVAAQRRVYVVGQMPDIGALKQRLEELGHTGANAVDVQFRVLASNEPRGRPTSSLPRVRRH